MRWMQLWHLLVVVQWSCPSSGLESCRHHFQDPMKSYHRWHPFDLVPIPREGGNFVEPLQREKQHTTIDLHWFGLGRFTFCDCIRIRRKKTETRIKFTFEIRRSHYCLWKFLSIIVMTFHQYECTFLVRLIDTIFFFRHGVERGEKKTQHAIIRKEEKECRLNEWGLVLAIVWIIVPQCVRCCCSSVNFILCVSVCGCVCLSACMYTFFFFFMSWVLFFSLSSSVCSYIF